MKKTITDKAKIVSIEELNFEELIFNYFCDMKYMYFCVVEKSGSYIGTISIDYLYRSIDRYELEYRLKTNNIANVIKLDKETISKISELYRNTSGCDEIEIAFVQDSPDNKEDIRNKYALLCEKLLHEGVPLIKVKIPDSVTNEGQQHKRCNLFLNGRCFYSPEARPIIEPILSKVSDRTYEELQKQFLEDDIEDSVKDANKCSDDTQIKGNNRIFFVGPCIVAGGIEKEENLIRNICKEELQRRGFQAEMVTINVQRYTPDAISELESYDLTNLDIVIIIEDADIISEISDSDIDIAPVFNSYKGDKWLFYDWVIHTTIYGNRLIADKIIEKIIPMLNRMKDISKKVLIRKTEKVMQLQKTEQSAINEFLDNCKNKIPENSRNVGAIVMNANPFTKGHRFLVDTAIKHVELLIVFVVEEDASYIPFKDRIRLVEEGVKDLHNVVVIPSGRYIISRSTFKNYFEKEILQSNMIDASMDIRIFGEYIARELHITKRFVGEEPIDWVTRQYNEQMKKKLPNYGVELVEIPRITFDDSVISASCVRELLKKGLWEQIKFYVPITTYEYLTHNKEFLERRDFLEKAIRERMQYKKIKKLDAISNMPELLKLIHENEKVAVYGIGIDAMTLLKEVPESDIGHIKYFDRKAGDGHFFWGQEVMSPEKLLEEYRNHKIIITSRRYEIEMYRFLRKLGVLSERIFFVYDVSII